MAKKERKTQEKNSIGAHNVRVISYLKVKMISYVAVRRNKKMRYIRKMLRCIMILFLTLNFT